MKPNTVPASGEAMPKNTQDAEIVRAVRNLDVIIHSAMMFALTLDDILMDRTDIVPGRPVVLGEEDVRQIWFLSNQTREATYKLFCAYGKAMDGETVA